MKKGRKGQSAMEYLMTYGWAILIVIIAGGVIWYYASQATTNVGAVKSGFTTIDVDVPWSFDGAGSLSLKAINKIGKDINITAVYIGGASKTINPTSAAVSSGATSGWITVTTGLTGNSGGQYKLDSVAIQYYMTSDSSQKMFNSTGSLSGTRS